MSSRTASPMLHDIILISLTSTTAQPLLTSLRNSISTSVTLVTNLRDLEHYQFFRAIIFDTGTVREGELRRIRRAFPKAFIVVYDPAAAFNPLLRLQLFDIGVNMVAHDAHSLNTTLVKCVVRAGCNNGRLTCPYCDFHSLTEDELWHHLPAYHINTQNNFGRVKCPICFENTSAPLQVHIHEHHGPIVRNRRGPDSTHAKTRLYSFSLVVCRHPTTGHYLLCQEFSNQGFWLPGGAVDPGESLTSAAIRETQEEAGVDVDIKGILAIEHTAVESKGDYFVRMRVIFYAEPRSLLQLPKSVPDFESAGACWCSYEQIHSDLRLRGEEPRQFSRYLETGGIIHPMSLLVERERSDNNNGLS